MIQTLPTEPPSPNPLVLEFLRQFAREFRPQKVAGA